ncbi:MAG: hypothetical protein HC902_03875, partial [Calothrix sp. SM1_5_4]|nr:hypothetical protein [Calothrix sp. SM1_5_4]
MKTLREVKLAALFRRFLAGAAILSASLAFAQSGPSSLNISGGLFHSNGQPVTSASVHFRLEIWDKAATCMLYSEEHLGENLSNTRGGFSLLLGGGTSADNRLQGSAVMTRRSSPTRAWSRRSRA